MESREQLINQHILEYNARLKHMDELFERMDEVGDIPGAVEDELEELRTERNKLAKHISELRQASKDEWQSEAIEEAGPMVVWDIVAKKLEDLAEKIERRFVT